MKFLSAILLVGAFFVSCSSSAIDVTHNITYNSEFDSRHCRLIDIKGPYHGDDEEYFTVYKMCRSPTPDGPYNEEYAMKYNIPIFDPSTDPEWHIIKEEE